MLINVDAVCRVDGLVYLSVLPLDDVPVPLVHRVLQELTQLTQWDNGLPAHYPHQSWLKVAFVAIPPSASCGILRFGIFLEYGRQE